MIPCEVCGLETCEDDARCDLFWHLDQYWYLDFGRDDAEPEPYEHLD